jgi:hypothetical protein
MFSSRTESSETDRRIVKQGVLAEFHGPGRDSNYETLSNSQASWYPGAGRPNSLAVTRANAIA